MLQPATAAVGSGAGASFRKVIEERMQAPREGFGGLQKAVRSARHAIVRALTMLRARCVQKTAKRLAVTETVALGEKRFVALLKVDGQEFLIGSSNSGISLLATLESSTGRGENGQ